MIFPTIITIFILLAVIAIVIYILIRVCKALMFRPHQEHVWKPDIKYEDIYINNINCWYFNHYNNAPTVLFCHGNSGNISHRNYVIDLVIKQKLNLLIFDYQGYGKSNGECDVKSILDDTEKVYLWLVNKIKGRINKTGGINNQIILWGESLGGGPASYIASKYPIHKLVLWATFASVTDMAEHTSNMRYFYKPLAWVTTTLIGGHKISEYLKNIKCQTLIVHSINDNIIPISNAEINYKSIPHNNKQLVYIDGSHSNPILGPNDMKSIINFLNNDIRITSPAGSPFGKMVNEFESLVNKTLKLLRM